MPRRRRSWPSNIRRLLGAVVTLARLALTPRAQLAAENVFLRRQLALYQERCVKPRRSDPATRVILVLLSRLLEWLWVANCQIVPQSARKSAWFEP